MSHIRSTFPDISSDQKSNSPRGPVGSNVDISSAVPRGSVGGSKPKSGPPEKWKCTYYFTHHNGQPAIFEYKLTETWWGAYTGYKLKKAGELNYGTHSKQACYKEGDLIFVYQRTMKELEAKYSELGAPGDDGEESVLSQLVMGFILGEPQKYRLSYKITKIHVEGDHKGSIEVCPVLFLDKQTPPIELEKTIYFNFKQFHQEEGWQTVVRRTAGTNIMITYFGETILTFCGGGVSGGLRAGARGIIKYSLKEAIRVSGKKALIRKVWLTLRSNLTTALRKATITYLQTLAKEVRDGKEVVHLREKFLSDKNYAQSIVQRAQIVAWGAFINKLLEEALSSRLQKKILSTQYSDVQKEIINRLTSPFAVGMPTLLVEGIAKALSESNTTDEFYKYLVAELSDKVAAKFKSVIELDLATAEKATKF